MRPSGIERAGVEIVARRELDLFVLGRPRLEQSPKAMQRISISSLEYAAEARLASARLIHHRVASHAAM